MPPPMTTRSKRSPRRASTASSREITLRTLPAPAPGGQRRCGRGGTQPPLRYHQTPPPQSRARRAAPPARYTQIGVPPPPPLPEEPPPEGELEAEAALAAGVAARGFAVLL